VSRERSARKPTARFMKLRIPIVQSTEAITTSAPKTRGSGMCGSDGTSAPRSPSAT
jgi:hypothetical protein